MPTPGVRGSIPSSFILYGNLHVARHLKRKGSEHITEIHACALFCTSSFSEHKLKSGGHNEKTNPLTLPSACQLIGDYHHDNEVLWDKVSFIFNMSTLSPCSGIHFSTYLWLGHISHRIESTTVLVVSGPAAILGQWPSQTLRHTPPPQHTPFFPTMIIVAHCNHIPTKWGLLHGLHGPTVLCCFWWKWKPIYPIVHWSFSKKAFYWYYSPKVLQAISPTVVT